MNYYIGMSEKQAIFTLLGGKISFYRGIYNPTSDAVWLAAFAPLARVKSVLDVGIGTGGVSLCALVHNPDLKITGIDVSDKMLSECQKNFELNKKDVNLINSDIFSWKTAQTFDLVITNPPYFMGTPAHHLAHHNIDLTLWIRKCIARVKPHGYFYMITDAATVANVISEINRSCGDIHILPLFGAKKDAERVMIGARHGTKGITVVHSGLDMNNSAVLRDGLTIDNMLAKLTMK